MKIVAITKLVILGSTTAIVFESVVLISERTQIQTFCKPFGSYMTLKDCFTSLSLSFLNCRRELIILIANIIC